MLNRSLSDENRHELHSWNLDQTNRRRNTRDDDHQTADNYGLSQRRGSVTQNGHRCQQTETESSTERQTANHKPTARFWHASICYTTEMEQGHDFWPVTRPDPVVERRETNPRQRLDSSIGISVNVSARKPIPFSSLICSITHTPYTYDQNRNIVEML